MDTDPVSPSVRFDLPSTLDEVFSPACNPEIIAYSPNAPLPVSVAHVGKLLAVQVAAAHMTTGNAGLRTRHLWGGENGVYSSDSDPVAVLVHSSGFALKEAKPDYASLVLVFAVLPPQEVYRPLKKNGLRSRDLQCFPGPSIRLECTCVLQTPATSLSAAKASPCGVIRMFNYNAVVSISNTAAQSKQAQTRSSQSQPDAMFTTSLSKEVAYKYSLNAIVDGGPHPSDWFASVMKGGGVLFIESEQQRWRLAAAAGGAAPLAVDVFNCTQPQNFDSPTQLLHPSVAWSRLQWSPTGLQIGGTASVCVSNSPGAAELQIKRFYWAAAALQSS